LKPIFITDVDGVLLSWQTGLIFFLNDRGLKSDHIIEIIHNERYMDLSEIFDEATGLSLSHEERMEYLNDYNNSYYICYLPAYNDAIECVNAMSEDYTFIAVTALSPTTKAYENRKANLDVLFPNVFNEIVLTGAFDSKYTTFTDIIKSHGIDNIYGYVDDLEHNLDAFRMAVVDVSQTIKPLMFRMDRCDKGDAKSEDVITINSWYEIEASKWT
jgi:hypothetical protein